MKKCPSSFNRKLKDINSGLFCMWNGRFNKWQILHKDPKTALIRRVSYVQTPTSTYMELDDPRVDKMLYHLKKSIPWDLVQKYDTTEQILDDVDRHNQKYEDKQNEEMELRKQEIIKDTMGSNSLEERFGTWN